MVNQKFIQLKNKSNQIRKEILETCVSVNSGHIASSLSCVDILVALYYGNILQYDTLIPHWENRDRFILSKGHAATALYCVLADLGFFLKKELKLCSRGGMLGGHPDHKIPGIEVATGSLGHGLGLAAGIALRAELDNKYYKTVVLLGDGECQEGSVWEAARFIGEQKLEVIGIVDWNRLSATDSIGNIGWVTSIWEGFGWHTIVIDGHSFEEIISSMKGTRPLIVIANTIKGKGISFMENKPLAHNLIPQGKQLEIARRELAK